jgi:hypothetical protein
MKGIPPAKPYKSAQDHAEIIGSTDVRCSTYSPVFVPGSRTADGQRRAIISGVRSHRELAIQCSRIDAARLCRPSAPAIAQTLAASSRLLFSRNLCEHLDAPETSVLPTLRAERVNERIGLLALVEVRRCGPRPFGQNSVEAKLPEGRLISVRIGNRADLTARPVLPAL